MSTQKHNIVIVGGGAGGLGLTTRLARKFKGNSSVTVTLIDQKPAHIWKPLLHEVATGSLDSNHDEISYGALARRFKFKFILADLRAVNTEKSNITIAPVFGPLSQTQEEPRELEYTQLVIAVGSQGNDFGTPGVAENAIFLDSRADAEQFHQRFIAHLNDINYRRNPDSQLNVVIVGGGATGVELSADLHSVSEQLEEYGFEKFQPEQLSITLLEAGPRLLAQLPDRISQSVAQELKNIGVSVLTNSQVTEVTADSVRIASEQCFASDLTVWAAGIRAPDMLAGSGLPVDRIGRVKVARTLNLENNREIFVLGDCCHCPMGTDQVVPPRAQSAHQMAKTVYKNLIRQQQDRPLIDFKYSDLGSLVSLSEYTTVGNLMGNLMRGTVFIEGWVARVMYKSLYRMHQASIHGYFSTALIILGDKIHRVTRSHLKLH